MGAGQTSKLKFALFSTFHRILNELIVSINTARFLIIIQVLQLCVMITNDQNKNLVEHINIDALKMIKIPLLYPFLVNSPLIYTYLSVLPVMILVILVTWGFVTIYRLPEKEHRKYESFK